MIKGSSLQHQLADKKSAGTVISNGIVVWLVCFGERVKMLYTLIGMDFCITHRKHTRTHLCLRVQSIQGQSVQSSALLFQLMELLCLTLHQNYHAQAFERDICSVRECPNYS